MSALEDQIKTMAANGTPAEEIAGHLKQSLGLIKLVLGTHIVPNEDITDAEFDEIKHSLMDIVTNDKQPARDRVKAGMFLWGQKRPAHVPQGLNHGSINLTILNQQLAGAKTKTAQYIDEYAPAPPSIEEKKDV